jgi:hypothetical protein
MCTALPNPARYVPFGQLGDQPNIIVDGRAQSATVLTLSHWPWNATPSELRRDTSTEIAFAYLERPDLHQQVEIISNGHFDEDGLLSMFALVAPDIAMNHRQLLIDTARAGDFGTCTSADAVRLSFVLAAYADAGLSPLPASVFEATACEKVSGLYRSMLSLLPSLLDDLPGQHRYWTDEYRHFEQSQEFLQSGQVSIDEINAHDIAIIHIPADLPGRTVRRYLQCWNRPVHPFAVHNQTNCNRLVWLQGRSIEAQYRYESWVELATRRTSLRVDLTGLATRLNTTESSGGKWEFEGVNEVAPRLHLRGAKETTVDAETFIAELGQYLDSEPAAWDPYRKPEDR